MLSTSVLLRNFYIGITPWNRLVLDTVTGGNLLGSHTLDSYNALIELFGQPSTPEETQVFEKICEVTKILQKSLEPLKNVSGNIHRMNMLITLCNKRLDSLDLKISEYEGKRKEPPGFELDTIKRVKINDGNT